MDQNRIEGNTIQRKKIKRWGIFLLIPLIIGVIVLCVLAQEWKRSLKIQRVVVEGSRIISAQQIFALANVPLKSPMFQINVFEVRKQILQQPFVKSVQVNRHLPDALHIQIEERNPIASVNNGQLRYIDKEAYLLPQIESAIKLDVPIINGVDGIQQAKVGEVISNNELSEAIELLVTAASIDSTMYHFISEINMNNGKDILLYSTDVGVPIIVGRGDFGKKLLTLHTFWNNFVKSQNTEKLQYVDLRFGDQVVVKWQSEPKARATL